MTIISSMPYMQPLTVREVEILSGHSESSVRDELNEAFRGGLIKKTSKTIQIVRKKKDGQPSKSYTREVSAYMCVIPQLFGDE